MDLTVISTLLCTIFGGSVVGGIMSFNLRKANKRKAEAEAKVEEFASFKEQITELHEMLTFERTRNKDLMQTNIEKENRIQEKDKLYGEQTKRLRDTQDREYKLRLAYNNLQLQFKDEQCRKIGCPYREPENAYSKRAKMQLGIAPKAAKALPQKEEITVVDIELNESGNDTDDTVKD